MRTGKGTDRISSILYRKDFLWVLALEKKKLCIKLKDSLNQCISLNFPEVHILCTSIIYRVKRLWFSIVSSMDWVPRVSHHFQLYFFYYRISFLGIYYKVVIQFNRQMHITESNVDTIKNCLGLTCLNQQCPREVKTFIAKYCLKPRFLLKMGYMVFSKWWLKSKWDNVHKSFSTKCFREWVGSF